MPSTINMKVATLSSVGSNSLGFWKFPSFDRGEKYTTTVYYVSFRTSSAGVIEIYVFKLRKRRGKLLNYEESINKNFVFFCLY